MIHQAKKMLIQNDDVQSLRLQMECTCIYTVEQEIFMTEKRFSPTKYMVTYTLPKELLKTCAEYTSNSMHRKFHLEMAQIY